MQKLILVTASLLCSFGISAQTLDAENRNEFYSSNSLLKNIVFIDECGTTGNPALLSDETNPCNLKTADADANTATVAQSAEKIMPKAKKAAKNKTEPVQEQLSSSFAFNAYVEEVKEQIATNERGIAKLKKIALAQQTTTSKKLEKLIADLEKEDSELKLVLQTYVDNGTGDWKIFKQEFNEDLAEFRLNLGDNQLASGE